VGAPAQSVDCERLDPGICEITPTPPPRLGECAVEAVPRNAPIKVRLTPGFLDQPGIGAVAIRVFDTVAEEDVPGELQAAGDDVVFFVPHEPWRAGAQHDVWVQAQFSELDLCFVTSFAFDTEPSVMGRILRVTPRPDTALDELEEGALRIDVEFEAATDDGPLGSIEYYLYMTRGYDVATPVLMWRARHQTITMVAGVALSARQKVEPACFVVVAKDGVGHTDASEPACFEPVQGNYFQPLCSAGTAPGGGGGGWAMLAFLVAIAAARRVRRRGKVFPRPTPRLG
jgi:MYXO-CTERM domain-containing protein